MDPSVAPGRMFRHPGQPWPLELLSCLNAVLPTLQRPSWKLFEFIEAWSGCSMFYLPKLAPSRACFRKMQLKQCDSSIGVKQA